MGQPLVPQADRVARYFSEPLPHLPINHRFHSIFQAAAIGINVCDSDGRLVEANRAFEDLVGYSAEELQGMQFLDITHPDDRAADLILYGELVTGQRSAYRLEKRYVCKDGSPIWVRLTVSLFEDHPDEASTNGDQQHWHTIGLAENITARKRAEDAARAQELQYLRLVDVSPEPMVVYLDDIVVYANPSALQSLGAESLDQAVGRPFADFVHPDFHEIARTRARKVLQDGEPAELVEEQFVRLDGRIIDVEATSIPITWEGQPAAQVVFRDVTERKAYQERLAAQYRGFPLPTYTWSRDREDWVLVDYNTAADTFTSGAIRSLIGMCARDLYPRDGRQAGPAGRRGGG